jgi:uncharacterized protein YkwD
MIGETAKAMSRPLRTRAALGCTALIVAVSGGVGATAAAAPANHHTHVRSFDKKLIALTNQARATAKLDALKSNPKLWKIAHAWAKHLAAKSELQHNPKLTKEINRHCPNWTSAGENVGYVTNGVPHDLFTGYMNDPAHRANILDTGYKQIGSASVKTTNADGEAVEWNVTDFAAGC